MTMHMRREAWENWIAALESGKYRQGGGALHVKSRYATEENERFCCLGILCKQAADAGAVDIDDEVSGVEVMYGGERAYLPIEVVKWAGLRFEGKRTYDDSPLPIEEHRGILQYGEDGKIGVSLALMNDQGIPFSKIAETIREKIVPV